MIRHICLMKLLESADGRGKDENFAMIKEGMESLVGMIDGLLSTTVLRGFHPRFDVCVTVECRDRESYAAYGAAPGHQKMRTFIHRVVEDDRPAFDCEL